MTAHPPPPESQLIHAARQAIQPKPPSMADCARQAGMSAERWRQIEQGKARVAPGVDVPVTDAPAETIAAMARVLHLTAVQLELAGRPDAADALERLGPHSLQTMDQMRAGILALQRQYEAMQRQISATEKDENDDDDKGQRHAG
ncbi:MAG TPA: hypothetical protein VEV61_11205 [Streptosporangiaceae bacterium]|nr:hypothetical protein [Streptosporangiaceae bacterium]